MKSLFINSLMLFCSLVSTQAAEVLNDYFKVTISVPESLSGGTPVNEIERIAQESIDYWASLFDSSVHKPTADRGARVNFTIGFGDLGKDTIASASVKSSFMFTTIEMNGVRVNYATNAEKKLRDDSYPSSQVGLSDFDITFSSTESFFYGATGTPGIDNYDFHSILVHEIAHGMGFISKTFTNSGQITSDITAFDSLYLQNLGYNANNFTLGADIHLGNPDDNVLLYNPDSWKAGSSIIHVDYSTYAVMNAAINKNTIKREMSAAELNLWSQMGWTLAVPEPSSTFLLLLTMPFALSYRRRKRA